MFNMKLTSTKRNGGHHMPCHSSISQAPLIGENTSEHLTPIPAHALTLQSPTKVSLQQPLTGTTSMIHNINSTMHQTNVPHSSFFPIQFNATQQDENYHLYHEPIDPDDDDDDNDRSQLTIEQLKRKDLTDKVSGILEPITTRLDNDDRQTPPPLPPAPRQLGTLSRFTDKHTSTVPSTPTDLNNNNNNSPDIIRTQQVRTFAERASEAMQDQDVSADVYFSYVTLNQSNERSNNRSRPNHGQKNSNNDNQLRDQFAFTQTFNSTKAHNSTSVTDLPASPVAITHSPTMPIHFRDHCVRELIETETNYVHALEMIINCFAKPLEVLLKRDQNQLIFGHIKYFYHVHSSLQADLIKAASSRISLHDLPSPVRKGPLNQSNPPTPTALTIGSSATNTAQPSPLLSPNDGLATVGGRPIKISTCFLSAREKFLKYGEYCASLSRAQALLDDLSKNEAIAAQLNRCQQEANEGRFKLRDLLSLPMQRILKYHLLLAQMIKNTSCSSDDYHGIKKAHEVLVDLGQYINEVKRDTEAMQILNDVEQSIIGLNMPANTRLEDYGRLIMDGTIRMKGPHELPKTKQPHESKRYVFVFDKVIFMCKCIGQRYQYREALVLGECELESNPTVSCDTLSKHKTDKYGYNFNLVRTNDKAVYSFYPKSQESKIKWINAIQKAMDNIKPSACRSSSHKFLMHTFERASSCDHCGKLLLGLYYQGYRCQVCFTSVHKKCISLVKICGPALPQKPLNAARASNRSSRSRCINEPPPSPSMRSENGQGLFMQFPTSISSSAQGVDAMGEKIEYSNLRGRLDDPISISLRKSSTNKTLQQRPASSMINVSIQNALNNNHVQQNRNLRESTSTPTITRQANPKVRAKFDFEGDERHGELLIIKGDTILLCRNAIQHVEADEGVSGHLSQLSLNPNFDGSTKGVWWFGRNLRTGNMGRFPSDVVEPLKEPFDYSENINIEAAEKEANQSEQMHSYVNFILNDRPWFCGRMERDEAQALLESTPHETFLVRVSPKHNDSYVISLNFHNQVKHMRIYISKDNQLYLSQNRYFKSVVELVLWYESNSLVESFHMLDARLSRPYKTVHAKAN